MVVKKKNLSIYIMIIISLVLVILLGYELLKPWSNHTVWKNGGENHINKEKQKTIDKSTFAEDKKFLGDLDKKRGKVVKIAWISAFVDPAFNWKSLEWFPDTKANLNKLITKLSELWLNDKNTNFVIKSVGDLPWPFLSVSVTDRHKQKTLNNYEKSSQKQIKKISKIDKKISNDLQNRINSEVSILANNDNNWYCISNTSLWIKNWTSVQVCPDKATLTKMFWKNKYILQWTNNVQTLEYMSDYVNKDMTSTNDWFKKIYNYNAYLLYFPFVINKNIRKITTSKLGDYYNDMLGLNKMLYADDWLLLVNIIKTTNKILISLSSATKITAKDEKNIIDNWYNQYIKDTKQYKVKSITSKIFFNNKVYKYLNLFKKYGQNINILDYISKMGKITPDNIKTYITIIDKIFQNSYFVTLLNDKDLINIINKNIKTITVKNKKWKEHPLDKTAQDKAILWFYTDIVNMLPNLAIDVYPDDNSLIQYYINNGLNNAKYSPLISFWFIQNQTNVNDSFQFFLYDISNGWIIIKPNDTNIFNFKKIWNLLKNKVNPNDINKILVEDNQKLFTPDNTCQTIDSIDKTSWLSSFRIAYKCSINNFVLDTFNKKLSKFNNRTSEFWTLLNSWKKRVLGWLPDNKYFLLLKLYPDVMYWRFDTKQKREEFFNDFKTAINILNNSTDPKLWNSDFDRIMSKYYKYFNDISDYKHLRANINTLNLIFYWQK